MQLATSLLFLRISQIIWFLRSEDDEDDVPSLSHLAEEAAAFLSFFSLPYFFPSPSSFLSAANLIVLCLMLKQQKCD